MQVDLLPSIDAIIVEPLRIKTASWWSLGTEIFVIDVNVAVDKTYNFDELSESIININLQWILIQHVSLLLDYNEIIYHRMKWLLSELRIVIVKLAHTENSN